MFLGNFSVANSVANENIPITTLISTNRKVVNNSRNNSLELRKAGIYNVDGWMTITGTATTGSVDLYEDENYRESIAFTIANNGDSVTVPIVDAVRVILSKYPEFANISLRVSEGGLSLAGVIRVEYLQ